MSDARGRGGDGARAGFAAGKGDAAAWARAAGAARPGPRRSARRPERDDPQSPDRRAARPAAALRAVRERRDLRARRTTTACSTGSARPSAVDPARGPLPRPSRRRWCSPSCSSSRRAASSRWTRRTAARTSSSTRSTAPQVSCPTSARCEAARRRRLRGGGQPRGPGRLGRALEALLLPGAGGRAAVRAPALGARPRSAVAWRRS